MSYTDVTIKTDSYGALIDTIIGNTVETKYTVEAAVQDLPTGAPAVNPASFTLYSYGHREGKEYIPTYLSLQSLYLVNDKGQPINASKAGTLLKAPLAARLIKISDTLVMEEQEACTDGSNGPCWKTTSNGVLNYEAVSNGNIAFAAKTGEGAAGQTTNEGSGKYQATYTTGPVPLKNTVEVSGTASLEAPEMLLSSNGTLIEYNYHAEDIDLFTNTLKMRTVNMPTGTYATFDKETLELRPYITSSKPIYTVYGIDTQLTVAPNYVMVDKQGYTKNDTTLTYKILPDGTGSTEPDAAYRASTVDIDFFTNTGTSIDDTWTGYMVGDSLQGQGTDVLTVGSYFDINVQNKAQVVLNRGGDAEVRSDKVSVKAALFSITKPTTTEKIVIKNDADGVPKMQSLTAQVELKGSGISPTTIESQQVRWKFTVEYLVDTNADSKKRARKGFDSTGVGQGKDGYKIPDPSDTGTPGIDYLPWQGSTFVIDETGSQGAKWGDKFGGGLFAITAKTTLDGVEISDTIESKIEGQKFSEDTAFKDKITSYLGDPTSDHEQPTVRNQVGYDQIFKVIAHKETNAGARCEHFYPSIYGQPKTAIYPVENGGGDGGYGMMQLTQWRESNNVPYEYPTYRQIWNWKENIDQGVAIVKQKLQKAINLHSQHPVEDSEKAEFLRWNVYQLYNSGKDFWKWEYDVKQKIDLWVGYQSKAPYAWDAIRIESNPSQLCQ